MRADHNEEGLMSFLDPLLGDQQEYLSVLDIEHTMEDAPSVIPRDRDADLLPNMAIACIERWSLGNKGTNKIRP